MITLPAMTTTNKPVNHGDPVLDIICDKTPIATVREYEDALIRKRDRSGVSNYELTMLNAFAQAPEHTLTAITLAKALGCSRHYANRVLGGFAREISEELHYQPRTHYSSGDPRWWPTIAYSTGELQAEDNGGHWEWVLRPEFLQALKNLRWVRA
jgi:hypothetical protein